VSKETYERPISFKRDLRRADDSVEVGVHEIGHNVDVLELALA
jgi:hypothetical protein